MVASRGRQVRQQLDRGPAFLRGHRRESREEIVIV
jgi:hypothetical protein